MTIHKTETGDIMMLPKGDQLCASTSFCQAYNYLQPNIKITKDCPQTIWHFNICMTKK